MLAAKKSLGQNFLNNPDVVRDILLASEIKKGEVLLEVGPGTGVLTRALLDAGARVIAVEKDTRMVTHLQKIFAHEISEGELFVVYGDILNSDISSLFTNCKLLISSFKIVANIPYYITGSFLEKFLTSELQPTRMVLMLQKEVAERIIAKDDKESILSISVKAYGTPSIVREVTRENFEPAPNVDSAVLVIENISREFFKDVDERKFFELVKRGFAHKRKKLARNLAGMGNQVPLEVLGNKRAEELSPEDWRKLSISLSKE